MPIQFACDICGQALQVAEEHIGSQAKCPKCENIQIVPTASRTPPRAEPAPISIPDDFAADTDYTNSAPSPYSVEALSNPYAPSMASSESTMSPGTGLRDYRATAPLASRGKRFAAKLIDTLILSLGFIGIYAAFIAGAVAVDDQDAVPITLIAVGIVGAIYVCAVLVYNWVLISTKGQSIGKRLLRMRIRKADTGQLPGFVYGVLMRNWVPALINQVCGLFSLVDALFIFNENHQCVHDLIATTCVVDVGMEESTAHESPFANSSTF